ncbi:MAG: hypothetical protein K0R78_2668 [Pelosinus sp.]|nr:hypothetical protein [Pelosinus sp.]
MSSKANELLSKLKASYDETGNKNFDSEFYLGYSDSVLVELSNDGHIDIGNDIIGSITLLV